MISAKETELVFNELSIIPPAANKYKAREWMSNLVKVVKAASKAGVKRNIRTDEEFSTLNISQNYSIYNWFTDNDADLEERRYLKSLSGKSPLINTLENDDLIHDFLFRESRFAGELAMGLGLAQLTDNLAISLDSDEKWNAQRLEISIDEMDENGEVTKYLDTVNHISKSEHIHEHIPWIQRKIRAGINNGEELWERRGELYPSLFFCNKN